MQQLLEGASVNEEGYLNVGEELGLSDERGKTARTPLYRTRNESPNSILAKIPPFLVLLEAPN
jgi:hypothetical protein